MKNNESNKNIPKRKRIFENFFVFGIEKKNLLNEINLSDFILTPKLLFSFPNESNLDQNIFNYFYTCCFPNGVNIKHLIINSEEEYNNNIIEKNFFLFPLTTFAFIKTSNNKYSNKYLFCIKFLDFYIFKENKNFNVFIYEKIYLFISNEILFHYLEILGLWFMKIKKINYLNNISNYFSLFNEKNLNDFIYGNDEKNNKDIINLLEYCINNCYSKTILYLNKRILGIEINDINNKNESYLCWIIKKIIWFYNSDIFFKILIMILLEQNIIFYGNDIELITFSSLLFSNIIYPFKWEFSLIPNLPLNNIDLLQSPSPFIVGLLIKEKKEIKKYDEFIDKTSTNLIFIDKKKIEIVNNILKNNFNYNETLFYLNSMIEKTFWEIEDIKYEIESEKYIKNKCEMFVNKIKESIYESIINKLKKFNNGNIKEEIKKNVINNNDSKFFIEFVDTVMFNAFIKDNNNN